MEVLRVRIIARHIRYESLVYDIWHWFCFVDCLCVGYVWWPSRESTISDHFSFYHPLQLEGFKQCSDEFSWVRIKPENIAKFAKEEEERSYGIVNSSSSGSGGGSGDKLGALCSVIENSGSSRVEEDEEEQGSSSGKNSNSNSNSEFRHLEYVLRREDVGHYIGVRYAVEEVGGSGGSNGALSIGDVNVSVGSSSGSGKKAGQQSSTKKQQQHYNYRYIALATSHGPVKPGPPRLLDFCVTGTMKVRVCLLVCLWGIVGG